MPHARALFRRSLIGQRAIDVLCKRAIAVALTALLLGPAGTAGAASSGDSTDAAFAALLSMPGVQPKEGGWLIPEDDEPVPADETALIARLQKLKRAGADFNAIRHRGTLLAHAIRAGKERTAIWLLANGANPAHVLHDGSTDAAGLARRYERHAVLRALERRPGVKPPPVTKPAVAPAVAVPASAPAVPPSRQQQAIALMERLLGPTRIVNDEGRRTWQAFSATLSREDYVALFSDESIVSRLVPLVRDIEGGLEDAFARLPLELVRNRAQQIADQLAEWSYVTYYREPKISYTGASRSWPALWRRLDRPLDYARRPDLAGRIPPALWPALFASGYAVHEADATGCLLSAVELPAFKALWPDFRRYFTDAEQRAPTLVLSAYRLARERSPCHYSSGPAETVAKLAFLRAQGITSPVTGLTGAALREPDDPNDPAWAALVAAAKTFAVPSPPAPRLVQAGHACELALDDVWLDELIRRTTVGWGVPAQLVQTIDVPGSKMCGLLVSGDSYADSYEASDSFTDGPSREAPIPRCADAPDDGEIWLERAGRIESPKMATDMRGVGFPLRKARDTRSGREYWLDTGMQGALCSRSMELPGAFEWRLGAGNPVLAQARDDNLIERLLSEQCHKADKSDDVDCDGLPAVDTRGVDAYVDANDETIMAALQAGRAVPRYRLIEIVGAQRKAAYRAAIATRDRDRIRQLNASGIAARWTAEEISSLGSADLPLEERRRRVALLFADAAQLDRALESRDLPLALLSWLPDQDWGPVLRVIARSPDWWIEPAARLRAAAAEAGRERLACEIDRAQGFLCRGGLQLD